PGRDALSAGRGLAAGGAGALRSRDRALGRRGAREQDPAGRLMGGRAVIIGGSLGGLFAAGFLKELGWQVDVYERVADELAARGAGIGTHGALFDALRRLGVEIDERLGIRVTERICLDAEGNTVHTQPVEQTMSHWALVYGALKQRIGRERYHSGRNFLSYTQGA